MIRGLSKTPEYQIWYSMIDRCTNRKSAAWKDYGGRGISVCNEWLNSFDAFLAYIGPRPSPDLTLDRIDNDRGYEPGNVRWVSWKMQASNRRPVPADHGSRVKAGLACARLEPFDTARHLDNPEVISHYLNEAFKTRDSKLILRAVQTVARAGNISKMARASGMSRTGFYWTKKTSPGFFRVLKVLDAVGVRLEPIPARPTRSGRKRRQPPLASRTSAHAGSRGRH